MIRIFKLCKTPKSSVSVLNAGQVLTNMEEDKEIGVKISGQQVDSSADLGIFQKCHFLNAPSLFRFPVNLWSGESWLQQLAISPLLD